MRFPKLTPAAALLVLAVSGCGGDVVAPADPAASVPSANSSTMYVTISGPTEVPTWWTCSWTVYVQGGTAPYSYHWGTMGMIETDAAYDYWQGYAAHGGNVGLSVNVTDANGKSAWGHLLIDSNNNAPFCHT